VVLDAARPSPSAPRRWWQAPRPAEEIDSTAACLSSYTAGTLTLPVTATIGPAGGCNHVAGRSGASLTCRPRRSGRRGRSRPHAVGRASTGCCDRAFARGAACGGTPRDERGERATGRGRSLGLPDDENLDPIGACRASRWAGSCGTSAEDRHEIRREVAGLHPATLITPTFGTLIAPSRRRPADIDVDWPQARIWISSPGPTA